MITILFDLDGTLIDSTEAIVESFDLSFRENNFQTPKIEKILELVGYPLDNMFLKLGVQSNRVDKFVHSYKMHYREISKPKTKLLKNAKEAIEFANSFATLGVVTTKTAKYSIELLEHMDVMKYFKCLIGRESIENPKPHPEPILKAIDLLRAKPQKCYMIGDTSLDILSAKSANITPIGVETGYERDLTTHNIEIKRDALEAVEFIKSLN